MTLEEPYPAHWSVREALDAYLAENGFTVEAYDAKWTEGSFLGLSVAIPNTKHHRWAIMLHDLHHVATGYGTDPLGEGEISAWELARGVRDLGLYVGSIVVFGALIGLVLGPRKTIAAWRASREDRTRGAEPNLFDEQLDYDALLAMTVGELRAMLGVPQHGVTTRPRSLHPRAPAVLATMRHVA